MLLVLNSFLVDFESWEGKLVPYSVSLHAGCQSNLRLRLPNRSLTSNQLVEQDAAIDAGTGVQRKNAGSVQPFPNEDLLHVIASQKGFSGDFLAQQCELERLPPM